MFPDLPSSYPPTKSCLMPYQSTEMQNTRQFKQLAVIRTFTYWSCSVGIGVLLIGSILTYIYHDQKKYTRDPLHRSLQITAIIFIIIGILLLVSSIIKIAKMVLTHPEMRWYHATCCVDVEPSESDGNMPDFMPDNRIMYNPYYPPILVPYNIMGGDFKEKDCSLSPTPDTSNFILPGSVFHSVNVTPSGEPEDKFPNPNSALNLDISIETQTDDMVVADQINEEQKLQPEQFIKY